MQEYVFFHILVDKPAYWSIKEESKKVKSASNKHHEPLHKNEDVFKIILSILIRVNVVFVRSYHFYCVENIPLTCVNVQEDLHIEK